jgi:uncharacterized protein YqfB (UPF0267 family)
MQVQVTDIKIRDSSSENFMNKNTEKISIIQFENLNDFCNFSIRL